MFSKADNYMNEGCFQSASSCVKYPYICELYLQKFDIAFIFYEILGLSFWLKSCLMLLFCVDEYIAKIYTKIIANIFSGRFDVHLQVIQPILKFPYLISLIKYPQVRHLK